MQKCMKVPSGPLIFNNGDKLKMAFDVNKHRLVPKHSKLSESDKKKLLEEYKINVFSLPKIIQEDPTIIKLNAKMGDVIKIERDSKTAGTTSYYRVVIES